ncbi:LAFE_0D11496g1_1 [Lachancea fermentati]|uniref:LAFE_0D11496g1_1 n=1 Tax=Lachancea fermentati TaxID=4955 RepID=A0A1G4MC84_LACFM|nr:LAFE_0D11496g1_1 [Lachancea fermentati]
MLLRWLTLLIQLLYIAEGIVVFKNSTSKSSARLWQVMGKLIHNSDILQELYPIVTGLEDSFDEDFDGDRNLVEMVQDYLSMWDPDVAALLPLHYKLNPGFTYDHSNDNYFVLNGARYYNADDVFYLKSSDLAAQKLISDDRLITIEDTIIGLNNDSPLIILYACDLTPDFVEFNRNLFLEASDGKIRYVWMSTCPADADFELLGAATSLTIKNYENAHDIIINPSLPPEFVNNSGKYRVNKLEKEQLSELDLKVATLIASNYERNENLNYTLMIFRQIIHNFPLVAQELASLPKPDSRLLDQLSHLSERGIDHNMLGFYVNGQYMRVAELSPQLIVDKVTLELDYFKMVASLFSDFQSISNDDLFPLIKKIISHYSHLSHYSLQTTQPIKYDLHRIPGFSESVIYFNDIEKDSQYDNLKKDLSMFLEKTDFGDLPSYRENWNEVIFVIDLADLHSKDTAEALAGMLRAIGVIKNGYPQRIGLLPLSANKASERILRKIYELKNESLETLIDFLKDLSNAHDTVESDFYDIPPVSSILSENLKVYNSSIIINGEIYPFKANNWNYLVAKVVKRDVSFLKTELRKIRQSAEVKVRNLLHSKSFTARNQKFLPDYFQEGTYFRIDVKPLNQLGERLIRVRDDSEYNLLHTVTLVDDFLSESALERLLNLLESKLLGVRLRVIHRGALSGQWPKLRQHIENRDIEKIRLLSEKSKSVKTENDVCNSVLGKWLIGSTDSHLEETSFIVINGRYIHFDFAEIPTTVEFESIIRREAVRTLDVVYAIEEHFPHIFSERVNPDFIEMLSAVLTQMFYDGENIYQNGIDYTAESSISRIQMGEVLDFQSYGRFESTKRVKPVDVMVLVDPLEERTQNFLSILSLIEDLPFINLQIVLMPTEDLKVFPIYRIWCEEDINLPETDLKFFDVDVNVPSHIHVSRGDDYSFTLDYIGVEVHAFGEQIVPSVTNVEGISNVCLRLIDSAGNAISSTLTMETFGYGLLTVPELGRNFNVESCDDRYFVESFSLDGRSDYVASRSLDIKDFTPKRIYVKIRENQFPQIEPPDRDDVLNIYSIIVDQDDESAYERMISIACQGSKRSVKFWIIASSLTPKFKEFLCFFSNQQKGRISFEFVNYNWPRWLRPQRFRTRELHAMKLIMLDVLFPNSISKLLYIDPKAQINDIEQFFSVDFFTVFCLPKAYARDGNPYWKEGYWKSFLEKNGLKFHALEPAFLVNMDLYRKSHAGDKLRIHYQRLSTDILSLTNIDQDLINDIQLEIPVTLLNKRLLKKPENIAKSLRELSDMHEKFEKKGLVSVESSKSVSDPVAENVIHDEL